MVSDDDFYKFTTGLGKDQDPKPAKSSVDPVPRQVPTEGEYPPLDLARIRARNYQDDKKIYIVRGKDLFVIESNEIKIELKGDLRNIQIVNARMQKYPTDS